MQISQVTGLQPVNSRGQVLLIVLVILILSALADLFNIYDLMGAVKRTLNSFLPGVFKECKFRKPVATTP